MPASRVLRPACRCAKGHINCTTIMWPRALKQKPYCNNGKGELRKLTSTIAILRAACWHACGLVHSAWSLGAIGSTYLLPTALQDGSSTLTAMCCTVINFVFLLFEPTLLDLLLYLKFAEDVLPDQLAPKVLILQQLHAVSVHLTDEINRLCNWLEPVN